MLKQYLSFRKGLPFYLTAIILTGVFASFALPSLASDSASNPQTMIRAINTAMSFQSGMLHDVEVDSDGFDIEIFSSKLNKIEIKVSPTGSEVIREHKHHKQLRKMHTKESKELLSAQQFIKAIEAASKEYPGLLIREIEATKINGKLLLKAKLLQGKDKHEVYISPSGDIVTF